MPSPPEMMNRVRDLALVVAFVGLTIGLSHLAFALADLATAPGRPVCYNPAGVNDVK